jgi:DNA-binding GntR family transcriptional regulator
MLARQEFEHIFELRLVLEPFVARRAAMKASPDGVKALWDLQASMVDSLRSRSRADEFATEDACWHDKIAELSGNPIVRDTLTRTHAHLHIYRLRRESVLAERAAQEHREVIDAVARHDARLAERAMRSHVANSRDRLFASMS